jgi:tRNA modification GTPase
VLLKRKVMFHPEVMADAREIIDTIAAVATPPGRGGVGIVRISGPLARTIGIAVLGKLPKPRYATYRFFLNEQGQALDRGIALYFPAPHSFTGEDVLELQGHGGTVVMDLLLKRVLDLGARLARPGEFSERAFLNEKLDLAQAEAVADLIDSHTEQGVRSAMRVMDGEFSNEIHQLVEGLTNLRVYVEAALDFPEEEIDFLAEESVWCRLEHLQNKLCAIMQRTRQGILLREGVCLVIAGRPNSGKSSLLNRLAGQDVAIVSEIPGTTRDIMQRQIQLNGLPIKVSDTAGLQASSDPIEREGIRRAWREIETADLVLLLIDDSQGYGIQETRIIENLPMHIPILKVWNKIDLGSKKPGIRDNEIFISARTGAGLEALCKRLTAQVGYEDRTEGIFIARRRHLQALEQAEEVLQAASEQLHVHRAGELMAEELHRAQQALGNITGEVTSDELLGKIFASFCIGK